MINKKIYIIIAGILFSFLNISANEYAVSNIPDSLKTDAYAVVRSFSATFTQKNKNEGLYKETKVITILSSKGDDFADFSYTGDKFTDLTSFSGIIRNASGEIVKKIKKGDLTSSNIDLDMRTLATDLFSLSYEYKSPNYPFTVEYTYEEKYKNGIISYPRFRPMDSYYQSVEKANYMIELPKGYELRYKTNFNCNIEELPSSEMNVYNISASNMKAISSEPLAPHIREIIPLVLFAPSDFCYDSFCGNMSDWKGYGLWVSGLLKDRDILPSDFTEKLKSMTSDAKDDREKVKILYEYLQNNTRYVSIQLGIGGLQPIEAATVYKTGFGDCKGLSNLMKAMLKAIDIPSNYCEIGMYRSKELSPDFANVNQSDHAILLVPLKNDSIWLECTSQTMPFGYIHKNIAGHDALIISEEGGEICRLPSYDDKQNLSATRLTINISEEGNAIGDIEFTEYLSRYGNWMSKLNSTKRDLNLKYLNEKLKFPKVQYGEISIENDKGSLPSSKVKTSFEASDYVNKTGNRLFIPLCPLTKTGSGLFTSSTRKADIVFQTGFTEEDVIIFNIPESYTPESLPKDIKLETPYGHLETNIRHEGNQIIYKQNISIYSGRHASSEYKEIKNFFSQISSAVKRKLVIKKQEAAL